ncbi:MAG: 30S ribosomal protein THX [Symploca sp. SIO3C6]|nr:30S ribosomal protein THX [Symploca sp. SIO3C6]NET08897.1 30S ribosomal protein THX [Symploca sp. SIO2B6]
MGRGDRRTRQGKVKNGSYGKVRPRKRKKSTAEQAVKDEKAN